jgi:hypothetical protein
MAMAERRNVEFAVEGGVMFRGWLFVPGANGPAPTNVSQPEKELTMNAMDTTKTDLHWNVLPDRVNPGSLWGAANTAKKHV